MAATAGKTKQDQALPAVQIPQATPQEAIESVEYLDGKKEKGLKALTRAGKALVRFKNGDLFEGVFALIVATQGDLYVRQGKGVYTFTTGAKYEGNYEAGVKSGLGSYTYKSGDIYRGTWKNGLKEGPGTMHYKNGDVFKGNFHLDHKHGKGQYVYANGAIFEGEWFNGECQDGIWRFPASVSKASVVKALEESAKSAAAASTSTTAPSATKTAPSGIIISGAPASGKGTQCEKIRSHFGVVHLSTGDMLRAAVSAGTEVGKAAKELMESGKLVPDEIVIAAIKERLLQPDVMEHGFLLDGFPRTKAQAEALKDLGVDVKAFMLLEVGDDILVERVTGRRIDPETGNSYHLVFAPPPEDIKDRLIQRADDTEEKVRVRLQGYHANIDAVRDFYAETLILVDGEKHQSEVWKNIETELSRVFSDLNSS